MHYLTRRISAMDRRWKVGLVSIAVVLGILYVGWVFWQAVQNVTLNGLAVACMFVVVPLLIMAAASSYWKEIFVAVVGMVVGAIAGGLPYLVVGIFLILLGLSPEDQASNEAFRQLFNNEVFNQLFFVAGAASGGPIAVYVYIERRKEREAESGKGSDVID